MNTFKKFSKVRLVQPVIEGHIVGGVLGSDGASVDYEVEYTAPHNGELRRRHFNGEELELVDEPDPAVAHDIAQRAEEQAALDVAAGIAHDKEAAK